jgi:hypothetical protein
VILPDEPKFTPEMVTDVPTGSFVGDKLEILGGPPVTVKLTPLLDIPATFTTTLPVSAPFGTVTPMLVALQLENAVTGTPLKVTVPPFCAEPKFVPVMVTDAPTAPEEIDRLEMFGVEITVNDEPLLDNPPTVTTTGPVPVAPLGTVATMLVPRELQVVIDVAAVPLNVTVLDPWDEPKFAPVMVTDVVPATPETGDR